MNRKKLATLPEKPGVYLMKDAQGRIIYVGKAKVLKNRVRSYFQSPSGKDEKTRRLIAQIADFETIITNSERDALLLENTLIKKHKPRYNVLLKDDKNYLSIRIDPRAKWPRIELVRRRKRGDRAIYFGPFSSAGALKETVRFLNKIFPLRTCSDRTLATISRPCIEYDMKRCAAPCGGLVTREAYGAIVAEVLAFLEGKGEELVGRLEAEMRARAQELEFEEAARLRDRIRAIETTLEARKHTGTHAIHRDIFGIYREGGGIAIFLLFVRGGQITGTSHQIFELELPDRRILASFLQQYYTADRFIPPEILLPIPIEDRALLESWLGELRGGRVRLILPKRGEKRKWVEMANKNAASVFRSEQDEQERMTRTLARIEETFHLRRLPRRIECYDVSNIHGRQAVASRVTFIDGQAERSLYRHYRIQTVSQSDDFAMMYEVLTRRLKRGKARNDLPDLIVVDGGKGQLNVALAVLEELGITSVDVVGLAKNRTRYTDGERRSSGERIFLPNRANPIHLAPNSEMLHLFTRIRNEAHRFAISYHRKLRIAMNTRSALEEIPGIGPKRRKQLLAHFGSLKGVREATREALRATPGLPAGVAERIYDFYHGAETNERGRPSPDDETRAHGDPPPP
ncbi:MAG: excinuclease ABC subunit UvrC [Deltaproteobacteria bacterium]|nr:MAG: excinuclease ABC subunit UvrC [Deltaproteobacteria bacterium]